MDVICLLELKLKSVEPRRVINKRRAGAWSLFRKGRTDWWINFFKDMSESGMLDLRNELYIKRLRFCFRSWLKKDLDEVMEHWNIHIKSVAQRRERYQ